MEVRLGSEGSGGTEPTELIVAIECLLRGIFFTSYLHKICCERFQYPCCIDR